MGFFDWLFGKQRRTPPRAPRPKVLSGLDDNSPQVVVEMGNAVMVMDREQFDYMYGENSAPNPTQRDLDQLLPKVTRVRALASGMFRGQAMSSEAVLDTSDAQALTDFRKTLRIAEDRRTFSHCSCLGGPTLELFSGPELLATIGLQHGQAMRWKQWKHDAKLCNGQILNDWLTRYGIEPTFLDVLLNNQYDAVGMMPLGLRRSGSSPLSRAEQRIRLVELARVRSGDLEAALADFGEAIRLAPEWGLPYLNRGQAHVARKDLDAAIADYDRVISHLDRPGSQVDHRLGAAAYANRSQVYRLKGNEARAAADLQEAERLATNPPRRDKWGPVPGATAPWIVTASARG